MVNINSFFSSMISLSNSNCPTVFWSLSKYGCCFHNKMTTDSDSECSCVANLADFHFEFPSTLNIMICDVNARADPMISSDQIR